MEELELEKAARRIEGESLSRVYYQSAGWADSPAWAGPGPHAVPLAVYLEMVSRQIFRVNWADQFNLHHGHGIAIARTPVIDRDLGPVEEATMLPAWKDLIGLRIQSAMIRWRAVSEALRSSFIGSVAVHGDWVRRSDYPQALVLGFERGRQFFIAAAHLSEGKAIGFANSLLVVFDRAQMERLGLA
jgi:hypothetical protein